MKNITKEERDNRAELLKREFINNPEFLKAFPHLEDVIRLKLKIPDDMHLEEYIKKNIIVSDKDKPYYEKSTNYFESLLYKKFLFNFFLLNFFFQTKFFAKIIFSYIKSEINILIMILKPRSKNK